MFEHKFPYKWYLKDGYPTNHGNTVFSCFACGGGSSMGYKLAGFDVIGMNELDPKMAECYIENHKPKYSYVEDIRTFRKRESLPEELFNLTILDGSPPCSSFSMSGNREKDWGKEKKFREGQKKQILDDLFFEFIKLGKRLQPKIIIAENVKGLLMGEAKKYVTEIGLAFEDAGYYVNKWLLDASKMGVPQKRERVFFIAMRKDLTDNYNDPIDMFNPMPYLNLEFNEKEIPFNKILSDIPDIYRRKPFNNKLEKLWGKCKPGQSFSSVHPKGSYFNTYKINNNHVLPTLATECYRMVYLENKSLCIGNEEILMAGSYPLDYNFLTEFYKENGNNKIGYFIGMSVPPIMMAQIASRIKEQWL